MFRDPTLNFIVLSATLAFLVWQAGPSIRAPFINRRLQFNWRKGIDAYRDGRYSEAIDLFEQCIANWEQQRHFDLCNVYCWAGACCQLLGRYEEAIEHFEKALREDPDHSGTMQHLAYLLACAPHEYLRDGDRARDLAGEAARRNGDDEWTSQTTLAMALAECGDFEGALTAYQSAMRLMPPEERDKRMDTLVQLHAGEPVRCSPEFDKSRIAPRPA